jgi:hypothetical protein
MVVELEPPDATGRGGRVDAIEVRREDVPRELARRFVERHKLPASAVVPLSQRIALEQQALLDVTVGYSGRALPSGRGYGYPLRSVNALSPQEQREGASAAVRKPSARCKLCSETFRDLAALVRHERHSAVHMANLRQERERESRPAVEEPAVVNKPELGPVARKLSPHSPDRHRPGDKTLWEHCGTLPAQAQLAEAATHARAVATAATASRNQQQQTP